MTTTYIPGRKVIAGGIAGILAWAILLGLGYFGIAVPLDLQALLPTLIGSAISYLVPPAQQDVVRRINDELVAIAAKSAESTVSEQVGRAAEAVIARNSLEV